MDNDGYVAEGPVMNVGIITHDGEMVLPPFEQTLAGVTLQQRISNHPVGGTRRKPAIAWFPFWRAASFDRNEGLQSKDLRTAVGTLPLPMIRIPMRIIGALFSDP